MKVYWYDPSTFEHELVEDVKFVYVEPETSILVICYNGGGRDEINLSNLEQIVS